MCGVVERKSISNKRQVQSRLYIYIYIYTWFSSNWRPRQAVWQTADRHAVVSMMGYWPTVPRCAVHCLPWRQKQYIKERFKFELVDRENSVGTATRYGLDGPGIESRWEARYSVPFQTGPVAHSASYTMRTGSFPGVKWPGRGVDHSPHLAPRLKKK